MIYYLIMHSDSKSTVQKKRTRTFIEEARRSQIIEATIDVLAEHGYINTSFSRIAKRANISASLIPYHFKNKEELTREVFASINHSRFLHAQEKVAQVSSARDKLRVALESDLTNMGTHPERWQAAAEILFSYRNEKGSMIYNGSTEDPSTTILRQILETGQKNGEFGTFDLESLVLIIDAARGTFLAKLSLQPELDLEIFTNTLVDLVLRTIKKENNDEK